MDAIKIDVEGFEDKVLLPYLAAVSRDLYPRAVILEANIESWQGDLIGALKTAGYQTSGAFPATAFSSWTEFVSLGPHRGGLAFSPRRG